MDGESQTDRPRSDAEKIPDVPGVIPFRTDADPEPAKIVLADNELSSCITTDQSEINKVTSDGSKSLTDSEENGEANESSPIRAKLAPGTVVAGKFKIIRLLATGGMSEVYEAYNIALERVMALKILHPSFGTEEACIKRFTQEARTITALNDPRIVRSYDFGLAENEQPYLAMDLVPGRSLATVLNDDGPLSVERAVQIFLPVCEGMEHAHRKHVVHRDLKPSNLIMDEGADGLKVTIVDFGIAKILRDESGNRSKTFTQGGEIFGSPDYMSPEQCLGLPVDERSDIYSLGCVIFEAVTGESPFHSDSIYETIYAQTSNDPPTLASRNPALASDIALEAVLLKALAKEPRDRYQTMAEMREALAACCSQDKSSWRARIEAKLHRRKAKHSSRTFKVRDAIAVAAVFGLVTAFCMVTYQDKFGPSSQHRSADTQWIDANTEGQKLLDGGNYLEAAVSFQKAGTLASSFNQDADRSLWRSRYPIALEKELLAYDLANVKTNESRINDELRSVKLQLTEETEGQDKLLLTLWHNYVATPSDKSGFEKIASKITELAHRYTDQGQYTKSEHLLADALQKAIFVLGSDSLCVGNIYHEQGRLYNRLQRSAAAVQVLNKALQIREKDLGANNLDVGKTLYNLCISELRLGHLAESERFRERALAVYTINHDAEGLAYSLSVAGSLALHKGKYDEAIRFFEEAIPKHQENGDFQAVRESTSQIIWLYNRMQDREGAVKFLEERLAKTAQGRNADLDNAFYYEQLGDVHVQLSNLSEAEQDYSKALFLLEVNEAPSDPNVRRLLEKYTAFMARVGKTVQAQPIWREKAAIDQLFGKPSGK